MLAIVGPSLHDVREVMVEGPAGLKALAIRASVRDGRPGGGGCCGPVARRPMRSRRRMRTG